LDNRLKLPGPKIDFAAVGTTGQAHDDFPSGGAQARYDHMRMYLIALLANQSSLYPPTQYREGTCWFDLTTLTMRVRRNGAWTSLSHAVSVADGADPASTVSLQSWVDATDSVLDGLSPEATFSGVATGPAATLPIPTALQPAVRPETRPWVWVNGLLLDPRDCTVTGGTSVHLSSSLRAGDRFTVLLRGFTAGYFHVSTISVP